MGFINPIFFFFLWPAVYVQPSELFLVTYVSGAQIINNPWVWYSHNIPLMIKMFNHNITQRATQATGLGVMISKCCPDSQHGRPDRHPTNVGCSFFMYMNDDVTNYYDQRPKPKTWTREDNQLALQCYFRSNLSQRGYGKRMIEIWQEYAKFQTTSQSLADQVRTIIKKGWFTDLEILEIHQKHMNKILIQYQIHQVVPNKNNPTRKNCQLQKVKTPHFQTIHYQATRKKHYRKNKI